MTKEVFYNKMADLQSELSAVKSRIAALKNEYVVSLNESYKHLLGKKVRVTYVGFFDHRGERTEVCYWLGYKTTRFDDVKPTFNQVKKDGTMSSREAHLYVSEILSMEEVE